MNIVHAELLDIYTRRGELTAGVVVEEATPPDSPLHERFNWDDASAAHTHRLEQARALIRSVKITITGAEMGQVNAFVHVPVRAAQLAEDGADPPAASYHPVDTVGQDARLTALALAQMERDWRYLRRRWNSHKEFWELIAHDGDSRAG